MKWSEKDLRNLTQISSSAFHWSLSLQPQSQQKYAPIY